jgi:hypothetical protein
VKGPGFWALIAVVVTFALCIWAHINLIGAIVYSALVGALVLAGAYRFALHGYPSRRSRLVRSDRPTDDLDIPPVRRNPND